MIVLRISLNPMQLQHTNLGRHYCFLGRHLVTVTKISVEQGKEKSL